MKEVVRVKIVLINNKYAILWYMRKQISQSPAFLNDFATPLLKNAYNKYMVPVIL